MNEGKTPVPGPIILLGSGETSPASGKILDELASHLEPPVRVSVLETPAGFELNSAQVAGRVAEFFQTRLQNYHPVVSVIPARKRGTPFSPENPQIVAAMLGAQILFLGPGSPSYAVRQLQDSLCWHSLATLHRLGSTILFSSAATIAMGRLALPVYEIYKVGEEPFWKNGLDFLAPFGLSLVLLPHWNNSDGGAELDTSCCYIGRERFSNLFAQLPPSVACVGIDEQTALWLDPASATAKVSGSGQVHLLQAGEEHTFSAGSTFSLSLLGPFHLPASPSTGITPAAWHWTLEHIPPSQPEAIPPAVSDLTQQRQRARQNKEWALADQIRRQILDLGWCVSDTPAGPVLNPRDVF